MIETALDYHTALNMLEFLKKMYQETRYNHKSFNVKKVMESLEIASQNPDKFFIAYSRKEDKIVGAFFGQIVEEHFSGERLATDLGMFVDPEFRGSPLFIKMLFAFEKWAQDHEVDKIILYHSTGIAPEKTEGLFTKLSYDKFGSMFEKEINHVRCT